MLAVSEYHHKTTIAFQVDYIERSHCADLMLADGKLFFAATSGCICPLSRQMIQALFSFTLSIKTNTALEQHKIQTIKKISANV